ncbi:MAG TPA: ATP-binding protein [Stellaceae bacterium]|jgi:two-component system phosphate regulon sensor histidine kinase PhoR|nr:ATP-binding protein [Stellaceae bacterium]
MWRDLGHAAGRVLLATLPLAVFLVVMFEWGYAEATVFSLLGLGVVLIIITHYISLRLLASEARNAIGALGPDAAVPPTAPRRLSSAALAIWPAALRLRRVWQEHSSQTIARLGAAEAIIAAVPDPLILIDRHRRVVGANEAAAEFIGPVGEPRDLAAALRNPLLLAAADAVLRGEPGRSVEFALSAPVERMLRARFARISDGSASEGAAAILTLHDVTELKRSEQMRADFVANAGHELKTPLATLIGFIETLLGPAREDAAARERFLGIMREQAGRMARLVDDLLSLSRIELNEHVAPTGRVALAPVIDEVARGLELRAGARDIRIARVLPADLPAVQGDRDELSQIFQNLLDNAVKYARPHSEVTVTGSAGSGAAAALVRVVVADQGDGIASEHLPRLTERFYRVDTARSRELGGTGLGLAIVKHILNRHRGRLDIASRLGEGSTFTVWLRAAGTPPNPP